MGPLTGIKIIELAGIGPGPFCGMMLSDMGAEVIRVDRLGSRARGQDVLNRGRKSIAVDLKSDAGREVVLKLCESADAIFEGFRPGVTERLGLGPDDCRARNKRLVYGRMTGWGQDGPMAQAAGHDINYIALTGALHAIGPKGGKPVPPLNLVGDFGGGGMFLAYGVVCALLEAQKSGKGQVVDTAMVDGAAALMSMFWAFKNIGMFNENAPGTNMLDTGAHFYDVFECADGKYVSIGSIEPQFYALLLEKTGLTNDPEFAKQMDTSQWPALKAKLQNVMKQKTQAQWCAIMEGTDVCFAPVLTMSEAAQHPHNVARNTFIDIAGIKQPAPAPRFSRTSPNTPTQPAHAGQHSKQILQDWGVNNIDELLASGAVVDGSAQ